GRTSCRSWRPPGGGGSSPLLSTILRLPGSGDILASRAAHRLVQAMSRPINAHHIVDQLAAIYDESVANLRQALSRYVTDRSPPDAATRRNGAFAYPELRIDYAGKLPSTAPARAFARLSQPGAYATSIARPELFREYL